MFNCQSVRRIEGSKIMEISQSWAFLQCLKHWQRSQDSCTPLKINVEAQNWSFVDLSPFSRGDFQVSCQFLYTSKLDEAWRMAARFESLSFVFSNVFSMAQYGYHTPPKTNGWNPKMEIWKMVVLFNWVIFRFHVNFHGCHGVTLLETNMSPPVWCLGTIRFLSHYGGICTPSLQNIHTVTWCRTKENSRLGKLVPSVAKKLNNPHNFDVPSVQILLCRFCWKCLQPAKSSLSYWLIVGSVWWFGFRLDPPMKGIVT